MSNTSNIIFSVEKGFRFFQDGISFFHFFMIEFEVPKKLIGNKNYYFSLIDESNKEIYFKDIIIDISNHRIVTPNSHEDPLVENDNSYFICFQIDSELLSTFTKNCQAFFYEKNSDELTLISCSPVGILSEIYNRYKTQHYSKIINNHQLVSIKNCSLTLHLGDSDGNYSEQYYQLKVNEIFDFSKYIHGFEYIGVQCSYENEIPEIEEKHIIVGQKGIYLSGYFYDGQTKISPPLPFVEQYQKQYNKSEFTKVNSIEEIINHYKSKKTSPKYFESNLYFLLTNYLSTPTYSQDKLYSDKKPHKKNHFLLENCKICPNNFKCIQIVPSGLSSELFKENITLNKHNDCRIFKLFDKD